MMYALLITVLFALFPQGAFAQVPLVVSFERDPLFEVSDFLPGDAREGSIEITNNDTLAHDVAIEAVNITDPDGLGDMLTLAITDSESNLVYSDVFGTFLRNGARVLGTLGSTESETYLLSISFIESANNSYKGKTLGFDICVGFVGGDLNCGGTVIGEEQETGGGGGGSAGSPSLSIYNERVTDIEIDLLVGTADATIEWDTNMLATSQVVYGRKSDGPFTLSMASATLGYPFATPENTLKVDKHTVLITGLTPGVEYVYRVVSRASPPTISYEHTFKTEEQGGGDGAPGGGGSGTGAEGDTGESGTPGGDGGSGETTAGLPGEGDTQTQNESSSSGGGSAGQGGGASGGAGGSSQGGGSDGGGLSSLIGNILSRGNTNDQEEGDVPSETRGEEETGVEEADQSNLAAALFGLSGDGIFDCILIALIVLIAIGIFSLIWDGLRHGARRLPEERYKERLKFFMAGTLLAVVLFSIYREWCVVLPLLVALLIEGALYAFARREEEDRA